MEDLQPHFNLQCLKVVNYPGMRMPEWMFLLKRLITFELKECRELKYMEVCGSEEEEPFHPFFENLILYNPRKLKGWRKRGLELVDRDNSQFQSLPFLPRLKKLEIYGCPKLMCITLYPSMKILSLSNLNESLRGIIKIESDYKFVQVEIDDGEWLNQLPLEAFRCLEDLKISRDKKMESLRKVKVVFRASSSFVRLRSLSIYRCDKLKSIVAKDLENLCFLV